MDKQESITVAIGLIVAGFTVCFIFTQMRGCEESRYKANLELGVRSGLPDAPRASGDVK